MSIIEIGLMSGFSPIERSLVRLSQSENVDGVSKYNTLIVSYLIVSLLKLFVMWFILRNLLKL